MLPTTVSCDILYCKFMFTLFKKKEYAILVHDVITSVDGDEDITWHTENNKPVLHVLMVCLNLFPTSLIKSDQAVEQFCVVKHPIQHHYHFC